MKKVISASILLPAVALIISTFLSLFYEPLPTIRKTSELPDFKKQTTYLLPISCLDDIYGFEYVLNQNISLNPDRN